MMRRFVALALLLSTVATRAEAAEPTPGPQWTVSVDPLTVLLGFVHVQVERAIGPHFSVYAGPNLRLFDSVFGTPAGPYKGYGVEVGVRGFVWGVAPKGVWLMLRGVLAAVVSSEGTQPGGYGSALAGYTGIIGPGLVLSGGLGVSYFSYGPSFGIRGFLPAAHTAIGWAF